MQGKKYAKLEKIAYDAAKRINAECNKTQEIKDKKQRTVGVQFDFHVKPATKIIEEAIREARPTLGERLSAFFGFLVQQGRNIRGLFHEMRDNL